MQQITTVATNERAGIPEPVAQALGKLVSFEEMRDLMTSLMPDRGVSYDLFADRLRWTGFVTRYIMLLSEVRTTIAYPPSRPPGYVIKASVTAPMVPDDQPTYLVWDWKFTLQNGDTVNLRHSLDIQKLLEEDAATITSG